MFDLSITADVRKIERKLSAFAFRQVPFATARALTLLAIDVQEGERAQLRSRLDRPTPFTLGAIRVKAARKDTQEARVIVQDITAAYLLPFEFGGVHKLIGKGLTWLNPKGPGWALLNQYGNFPARTLNKLKRGKQVFIGTVRGVGGVWYRQGRGLTLLIRFGDAQAVRQHLSYRERAQAIVAANIKKRFGEALAYAIATSTRAP